METTFTPSQLWRKHIALPQDHGSWVFILSPLIAGIAISKSWKPEMLILSAAVMAAFLARQPLTVMVKVFSKRKPQRDLPAALFWASIYGLVALVGAASLALMGYGYLLTLAIPGMPVFAWHLWLVSRRSERRQLGVMLVATGVLALASPAGYWLGKGTADPMGWVLWACMWFQSAASIVHAYMRLEQREMNRVVPLGERLGKLGSLTQRAWLYTGFNLGVTIILGLLSIIPLFTFAAYLVQWLETIYTSFKQAVGVKPTVIGIRQLVVSIIFTVVFIAAWIIG